MKILVRKILPLILLLINIQLQSQSITVMTFNIRYDNANDNENWWDNRKDEVVNLIEYYHPDFLGIQEGLNHQVKFIRENTTNYRSIGVGRDDGKKKGEFSAIYYDATKFELIEQITFWLSEDPDTISIGWDAALERICTYGKFKDKSTSEILYIFNTHFDHKGEKSRIMSTKLILNKIEEYSSENSKVVVMGDLNSEPRDEPILNLKTKFDDAMAISAKKFYGPIGTFNNFDTKLIPNKRIDYIFTQNLNVISYRHIDDRRKNNLWVSDHLPVLIEINNVMSK